MEIAPVFLSVMLVLFRNFYITICFQRLILRSPQLDAYQIMY